MADQHANVADNMIFRGTGPLIVEKKAGIAEQGFLSYSSIHLL